MRYTIARQGFRLMCANVLTTAVPYGFRAECRLESAASCSAGVARYGSTSCANTASKLDSGSRAASSSVSRNSTSSAAGAGAASAASARRTKAQAATRRRPVQPLQGLAAGDGARLRRGTFDGVAAGEAEGGGVLAAGDLVEVLLLLQLLLLLLLLRHLRRGVDALRQGRTARAAHCARLAHAGRVRRRRVVEHARRARPARVVVARPQRVPHARRVAEPPHLGHHPAELGLVAHGHCELAPVAGGQPQAPLRVRLHHVDAEDAAPPRLVRRVPLQPQRLQEREAARLHHNALRAPPRRARRRRRRRGTRRPGRGQGLRAVPVILLRLVRLRVRVVRPHSVLQAVQRPRPRPREARAH
eukprot:Rhum_TRINITY_DN14401_c2_g1::Rhum_TRINITY_DN14401_c2_g1_i2::g.87344::m.87344